MQSHERLLVITVRSKNFLAYYDRSIRFQALGYSITIYCFFLHAASCGLLLAIACGFLVHVGHGVSLLSFFLKLPAGVCCSADCRVHV